MLALHGTDDDGHVSPLHHFLKIETDEVLFTNIFKSMENDILLT